MLRRDNKSKLSRKVALASFVGTTIEWYDFYLYGIAAALVFNKIFFPKFDPIAGIMAAYATYAVGFFARPVGGIIFGHFGDKLSRKKMLVITLTLMGIATCFIGLLPTYNHIGIYAPILLVLLRCIQGIGVGGEWGGAVVMAAEHSRDKERGFYSSWPNAGAPFGLLISILIFIAFSSLPPNQFMTWGWRIPFLLSIVLVIMGLFIRLNIIDSSTFVTTEKKKSAIPLLELVRTSTKNIILVMGARFAESTSFYIFTVFVLSYSTSQLGLSKNTILCAVLVASVLEVFTIPFFGHASDHFGRRPIYLLGAFTVGLFAFPFFWLLQTKQLSLIYYAVIFGLCIGHAAMHGAQAAFFSELFKTRVRYSGTGITYHLAAAFSGGLAPLIATGLVAWTGKSWPVSIYIIIMVIITIVCIYLLKETHQKDISS